MKLVSTLNVKIKDLLIRSTKTVIVLSLLLGSFYSCSEDDENEPIVVVPSVTVSATSLDFGDIDYNESSEVLNYQVTRENLTNNLEIVSPTGYQISKSASGPFEGTLVLTDNDYANNVATIYVQLNAQTTAGTRAGNITHQAPTLDGNIIVAVTANILEEVIVEEPIESTLQWIEHFDYEGNIVPTQANLNDGDLNRAISSNHWVSVRSDTDGVSLTNDQLTFAEYPSSAQGRTISLFYDGTDLSNDALARNLETMITMDENNNVTSDYSTTYVSFLYTLKENNSSSLTWPVSIGEWAPAGTINFNTRVLVDVIEDSKARIGVQFAGAASRQYVDDVIEVGKTYLIVLKNEKFDGSTINDIGSVFVFEAGTTIPMEEPEPTVVTQSSVKRQNENVVLTENNAVNSSLIGGLRVANTWESLFEEED